MTVHVFHVGFGIFEGMSKHGVLRLKVAYLTIEVVVFDLEPLHFLLRRPDTIRNKAFDDLLNAVAVLQSVDESRLSLGCESIGQLRREEGEET